MSAAQPSPSFDPTEVRARFALDYIHDRHRRLIAGEEVIVHCHHYNSRIQRTVEGAAGIDGKTIFRSAARNSFVRHIAAGFQDGDPESTRWAVAQELFAELGYGTLDLSDPSSDTVRQTAGHFVEGWGAAFNDEAKPVCTLAEGYIEAAYMAVRGESVEVRETECMHCGASSCGFSVRRGAEAWSPPAISERIEAVSTEADAELAESNIDENAIINAVVGLPIRGGDDGLIPAFGVYLANTPADFYNQVAIEFVEAMTECGQREIASRLLSEAGESCAMNTFRGIMDSAEWEGLVKPMLQNPEDTIFALVALSNAFGWGNWRITEHEPGETLEIVSFNGYEALGFLETRGRASEPQCWMLQGVSAGMMALVYGEGSFSERFGTYLADEHDCIAKGNSVCAFAVEES